MAIAEGDSNHHLFKEMGVSVLSWYTFWGGCKGKPEECQSPFLVGGSISYLKTLKCWFRFHIELHQRRGFEKHMSRSSPFGLPENKHGEKQKEEKKKQDQHPPTTALCNVQNVKYCPNSSVGGGSGRGSFQAREKRPTPSIGLRICFFPLLVLKGVYHYF